jgi:hypothetical protein
MQPAALRRSLCLCGKALPAGRPACPANPGDQAAGPSRQCCQPQARSSCPAYPQPPSRAARLHGSHGVAPLEPFRVPDRHRSAQHPLGMPACAALTLTLKLLQVPGLTEGQERNGGKYWRTTLEAACGRGSTLALLSFVSGVRPQLLLWSTFTSRHQVPSFLPSADACVGRAAVQSELHPDARELVVVTKREQTFTLGTSGGRRGGGTALTSASAIL